MHDIITIGDAMLDFFIELEEASILSSTKEMKLNLCVHYADKVPAKSIDAQVAGNSANVAVGVARLGLRCAFYSVIGDDTAGKTIYEKMKKEHIGTEYLVVDKGKKNNYSFVLNYKNERTILLYHEPRTYKFPRLKPSLWVYLSSLGNTDGKNTSFLTIHDDVVSYVKKTGAKLAFNPGTFQIRMKKSVLRKVLKASEVVFINVEEAADILGLTKPIHIKKLLHAVFALGPRIVVITDGPKGAYAFDGGSAYKLPIFPSPVVERTGAGDSFATAFVAALFYNKDVACALQWGALNSSSVVSYVGPQPGLLTKSKLLKLSKHNPNFKAKKI